MQIINLKEDFEIYGLKAITDNSSEMSRCGKITSLWKEFLSLGFGDLDEIYAVYHEYESDINGFCSLIVGAKNLERKDSRKVFVKNGKYAMFSKDGTGESVTIELWHEIWSFFKSSNLQRVYESDFEKHLKDKIEIYISIK
ncbi:effector binding domain-containing protein [Campylobacter sp. RM6883]|uniref:GyrI-like domain-containing protein n=1 Tax=Campylobacter californiensis TaxID=1032243 RepID=UPI00145278F8|nr:effector binding domain-containing protein [Campylobacter sp. RM6914]MBE2983977.1 effector binding domain-containing protein [Campylobacter sp. RM6883]MBE2994515.1 effector binding domain-containing protein [Campylobacter sp. RM6913]QCD51104.1 transcriptional regulator [Campylobacter sp. RM6914]